MAWITEPEQKEQGLEKRVLNRWKMATQ